MGECPKVCILEFSSLQIWQIYSCIRHTFFHIFYPDLKEYKYGYKGYCVSENV